MKILISSHFFSPNVGGIETVSAVLATEFSALGHDVRLVTQSVADDKREWPFEVLRAPKRGTLLDLARWCDIYWQNNISLQSLWPLASVARPVVITSQTWLLPNAVGWLKHQVLRWAAERIYISAAVAAHIGLPGRVIYNPYDEKTFHSEHSILRTGDLVFVGRLVSDKGVDLVLEALSMLRQCDLMPRLTIIGDGPEEGPLREMVCAMGLDGQVSFAGRRLGVELARELARHKVMVVPSRWEEPFGIVAVEGIAAGCLVVAATGGGLGEAVGAAGRLFQRADAASLAEELARIWAKPSVGIDAEVRQAHLAQFQAPDIAREYLEVFDSALK